MVCTSSLYMVGLIIEWMRPNEWMSVFMYVCFFVVVVVVVVSGIIWSLYVCVTMWYPTGR